MVNPSDLTSKHRLSLQDGAVMSLLNNCSHATEHGRFVRAAGDARELSSAVGLWGGLKWVLGYEVH